MDVFKKKFCLSNECTHQCNKWMKQVVEANVQNIDHWLSYQINEERNYWVCWFIIIIRKSGKKTNCNVECLNLKFSVTFYSFQCRLFNENKGHTTCSNRNWLMDWFYFTWKKKLGKNLTYTHNDWLWSTLVIVEQNKQTKKQNSI